MVAIEIDLDHDKKKIRNRRRKIIKTEAVRKFETSSHGIPRIFKSKHWVLRVFWTILTLAGFAAALYFIIKSTLNYYEYPVQIEYSIVPEFPSNYPTVTFCNLVPFNSYNNKDFDEILKNASVDVIFSSPNPPKVKVGQASHLLQSQIISNITLAQLSGFSIDSLLLSCIYNGVVCGPKDFYKYYDYNYGNCYAFNYGNLTRQTGDFGPKSGLQMELFTGIPGRQDLYSIERGIYLAVTNASSLPLTNYEGIKLAVGESTNVMVTRRLVSNLPPPYSNCRMDVTKAEPNDSPLFKRTLALNQYSVNLCRDLCLQQNFIFNKCNCYDPTLPPFNESVSFCSSMTENNCSFSARNIFYGSLESIQTCSYYCPTPCNNFEFETALSHSNYPTDYYFNLLNSSKSKLNTIYQPYLKEINKTSLSDIKETVVNSILAVNIYYKDLSYAFLKENPAITVDAWFGTVGGVLGLFMGISMLTLCELFEFLFLLIVPSIETKENTPNKNEADLSNKSNESNINKRKNSVLSNTENFKY